MALARLFEPLRLRSTTVRNRVVLLPMGLKFASAGVLTERDLAFHRRRAIGGVGLLVTGGTIVHPTSSTRTGTLIEAYRPENRRPFERLAATVHDAGATIVGQLFHRGSVPLGPADGPSWAPSPVPSTGDGVVPHEMTSGEIEVVVESFADAAASLCEAGFDGVEIHGAHGYLVAQFLSARTNRRRDRYGGSAAARSTFLIEVIDAIRGRIGEAPILGLRLSADELVDDGLRPADTDRVVDTVVAGGRVDYLSVAIGTRGAYVADMATAEGVAVGHARRVRDRSGLPVLASQRITHPPLAEQLLESGAADLVGLARALIADPDWVRKAEHGELDRILPCLACVQNCRAAGGGISCVHNPESGRELEPPPAPVTPPDRRRVVVVGAGPAGLEAARVASERGHDVVVLERDPHVGGQLRAAASAPNRAGLDGALAFRSDALDRLGVPVRTGVEATREAVLAERPDVVVLAIGARPAPVDIPGADLPHVRTVPEVLAAAGGLVDPTGPTRAVVIDADGSWEAYNAAERLAELGAAVTILTARAGVAEQVPFEARAALLRRLRRRSVEVRLFAALSEVRGDAVLVYDPVRLAVDPTLVEEKLPAELVVFAGRREVVPVPADLRDLPVPVHLVGDCVAPGDLSTAVRSGHRVAVSL